MLNLWRAHFCLFAMLAISLAASETILACDCGDPGPACTYVGTASAIFVGTVVFTDDDGSGSFMQRTFVKFHVEEAFKGLSPNTQDVWVDPGSFTSCYADYHVLQRLLVFGYERQGMPHDAAMMSIGPKGTAKEKPLPPGIDPDHLPTIYWAPECSGTRLITPDNEGLVAPEIEYLRQFKAGTAHPLVTGRVFQDEDFGIFEAPGLPGVKVTITGPNFQGSTQTDADGRYFFNSILPGHYILKSFLFAYKSVWDVVDVDVPSSGCGWADFDMIGSGKIEGQLLGHDGQPARHVKVVVLRLRADGRPVYYGFKESLSDSEGRYQFENLPEGNFRVGVNLSDAPDVETPYLPTTWSENGRSTIHLDAGEQKELAPFSLPKAALIRQVSIRVAWPDGRPAKDIDVWADVGGEPGDHATTDADGRAQLELLDGLEDTVEAKIWVGPPEKREVARSGAVQVTPRSEPAHLDLILKELTPNYR